MSASDAVSNPPAAESKSSRKKKAKAALAAIVPGVHADKNGSEEGIPASPSKTADGVSENAYIKEFQKQIRNINKKLNAMQKVDSIIEANPDVSLDELVAQRKINQDQKASALKKPQLKEQLAQFEEQLAQYKKIDQEYQQKLAQEKDILQQSHSKELEKLRDTVKVEAELEKEKSMRENLLTLSRFLRAAAHRRQLEEEEGSELSQAFEGVLVEVYSGDATAVDAAMKLIKGSDDAITSMEGNTLSITYAQVKQSALEDAPFAAEEQWVDDVAHAHPGAPESDAAETTPATDPTIANAGLTEQDAVVQEKETNGNGNGTHNAPPATDIDTGAANAAASEQWDRPAPGADESMTDSFEMVPRDPAETESPAAPAPVDSTQSWEPQAAAAAAAAAAPTPGTEHRGGRGRGGFRGEGRGGFRGRGGQRGDGRGGRGRGRGRGEFRGHRGDFRGGRGGAGTPATPEQ